ncbi:helix-turn-helix transcriptional regulator [Paracoccus thiocyanatus]|nr:helix-turn-helix transcriptional regulator [Paracoccus thiocyanatus]
MIGHIERCLDACGGSDFAPRFADLAQHTHASQVMVFDLSDDHAACLFSRNFCREHLGERLAREYLDGWFRKDPLLPELMNLPRGQRRMHRMSDAASLPPAYRARFFDLPKLAGKLALLAAGSRKRLFVNFYFGQDQDKPVDEALAGLLAKIALMHYDGISRLAPPPALDVLSTRERQVCLGMLEGKKAELIAADLDLSPETVSTYRKRAYDKLGISSRGALFALCKGR